MSATPVPDKAEDPADEVEASRAPLMDHLLELRTRLVRILIVLFVLFCAAWFVTEPALKVLLRPLANAAAAHGYLLTDDTAKSAATVPPAAVQPAAPQPGPTPGGLVQPGSRGEFEAVTLSPLEMIFVRLKLSFLIALAVGFPYVAFQVYAFVAPGLYKKERTAILPFLFVMPFLFVAGSLLVYYSVLPMFMDLSFSAELQGSGIKVVYQAQVKPYYELSISLLTAFGLAFQLPVVLALLAKAGLVEASGLRKARKYAFVAILIVAAVMTPPDPISQFALAIPLLVLYEAGVIAAAMIGAGRKRREEEEAKAEAEEEKREAEAARKRTEAATQSAPALPAGE
ncbi:MAG: twin-arginine translocase subunit TatC [Hyphomonadaceae bacterium]|nr:twin-arginine translocase subunit TatC [Hyphomonadaceae bacterium]